MAALTKPSSTSPRVFALASVVVGLTVRVSRPPAPGETLTSDLFDLGPGGKGLNQIIACHRQGALVDFIAAVGDDLLSQVALKALDDEGLNLDHVKQVSGSNTGVGLVTLCNGDNTIVVYPGANQHLTPDDVDTAAAAVRKADIVMSSLETPLPAIERCFEIARDAKVRTLLNPAPMGHAPLPDSLLGLTDIITPNQTEARALCGVPPTDQQPVLGLLPELRRLGPDLVVVTLGSDGALVVTPDRATPISAIPVSSIDPTGAGDCFNATLAVGIVSRLCPVMASQRAAAAGAMCTKHTGVICGLPNTAQLDAFLAEHPDREST